MTGIQILLVSCVLLLFFYYVARIRNAFFDLTIVGLFCAAAIFFILYPDTTNTIAHRLGVGRGADLLLYCCILFFLFLFLKLFARMKRMEKVLTEIVRDKAKTAAVYPQDSVANK